MSTDGGEVVRGNGSNGVSSNLNSVKVTKVVKSTFGRINSTSTSLIASSTTGNQRIESHSKNISSSRPTTILRKVAGRNIGSNSQSNSSSSSQSSSGLPKKDDVEEIIDEVFFDPVNKERLLQNLQLITESRFAKLFVTYNGGDIKTPMAPFKEFCNSTFGEVGYELYLYLWRFVWVSLK